MLVKVERKEWAQWRCKYCYCVNSTLVRLPVVKDHYVEFLCFRCKKINHVLVRKED